MAAEFTQFGLCFFNVESASPKFFGFGEYLAGLALLVLAWTHSDFRYRFRVRMAPFNIHRITFIVIVSLGLLTLITDLWRSAEWPIPCGPFPQALWQGLLGLVFLATFTTWAWYSFRTQAFGPKNCRRYQDAIYLTIIRGNAAELATVAEELAYSTEPLVRYATNHDRFATPPSERSTPSEVEISANTVLSVMANARFCRIVTESSPGTAANLIAEVSHQKRYGVAFESFARNFIGAAVSNRESFIYQEEDAIDSGALGTHRPVTQAIFGDARIVRAIGFHSFPSFEAATSWSAPQWNAFLSAINISVKDYVQNHWGTWSHPFTEVFQRLHWALAGLSKTDGSAMSEWDRDEVQKLRSAIEFYKRCVSILDENYDRIWFVRRQRIFLEESMLDDLAELLFECIVRAGGVRSDIDYCWTVQHNTVWGSLDSYPLDRSRAHNAIMQKLTRLLHKCLQDMTRFPNYQGARAIALMLNVIAFDKRIEDRRGKILQRLTIEWMRRNYPTLHATNPVIASECLVEAITYDPATNELIKQYRGMMGGAPTFQRISIT